MAALKRIAFRVPLRIAVGDVTERAGELIEGPEGWGEFSPLPSWSAGQRTAAEHAAIEAATQPFPDVVRDRVDVNAMIPRISPARAAALAQDSGCSTIKVKVGDAESIARVRAIRDALPDVTLRIDANGAWNSVDEAVAALRVLAEFRIEYAEDPVPTLEDLAALRRVSPMPIAAEACVRTIDDARALHRLRAADVFVVKPQRIGGIRAALAAAEEAGVPCVPSSALETSVGLSAVLAVAAALPSLPYAAGIGTALLLERDVTDEPLLPREGVLIPRRVAPTAVPA